MDPLAHVFLPLLVAYVLVPEWFPSPAYVAIGTFGLLPDVDKLLGVPGMLHSLVTVVPLCLALVALDRWLPFDARYGALAAAFVLSHLFLDFLDGSGFYVLYPVVEGGLGLSFPMVVTFGEGLLGFQFEGAPVVVERLESPTGFAESSTVDSNTFGFFDAYGFATALAFLAVVVGRSRRGSAGAERLGACVTPDPDE